jgi:hypothetical protein
VIADATPRALMSAQADPQSAAGLHPYVRELMQTPRRQAERLQHLIAGPRG